MADDVHHDDRDRIRRDRLLRATHRVAGRRGRSALSHRSITAAAGVPLATLRHLYSSLAELEAEAIELRTDEQVRRIRSLAADLAARGAAPAEVLDALAEIRVAGLADERLRLEVLADAAAPPMLRTAVEESVAALAHAEAAALAAATGIRVGGLADALVALEDGYALRHLGDATEPAGRRRARRTLLVGALVEAGRTAEALALAEAGRIPAGPA